MPWTTSVQYTAPEPPRHQVRARHDHEEQGAHLERDPVPRGHRDDVSEALRLHLDVEDGEKDGDQGHDDPHGFTLIKIGQHVRRRDVAEAFTQGPDADPERVGDRPGEHGPRARLPKADPMPVEKPARAEKSERGVVGGHNREVQDHETGLPAVQEKVLEIHGHRAVGQEAQHDRDEDIEEDQPRRDDPTLHALRPRAWHGLNASPEGPKQDPDQREIDHAEVDVEERHAQDPPRAKTCVHPKDDGWLDQRHQAEEGENGSPARAGAGQVMATEAQCDLLEG